MSTVAIAKKTIFFVRFIYESIYNRFAKKKSIFYITEPADWVIKNIGMTMKKYYQGDCVVTASTYGIRNSVVHYGSVHMLWNKNDIVLPHKSNRIVATWFHVVHEDEKIKFLPKLLPYVQLWHTASQRTKAKLISLGIPQERIVVVPLGVDTKLFSPVSTQQKKSIRRSLKIPSDKIVIGSFQKDGVGWGEGLEPKLIKGPDVFCEVIAKLAKRYDIFILLTGPSRGYVKNKLDQAGIPYVHRYLKNQYELADYYRALDLYLVTSREEGGPLALLESMASGIPLVTTPVGMASDIIRGDQAEFVVRDMEKMVEKTSLLINNSGLRTKIINRNRKVVENYDWSYTCKKFHEQIYTKLM